MPALVQGRTISSADDIAALLHGRVSKRLQLAESRHQPERIVGLFTVAAGVTDPDLARALEDRRGLIEQRTRSLTLEAIERREPWAMRLGQPPADQEGRAEWLRQLDTIAAYCDRWRVHAGAVLGGEPRSPEQMAHQQAAQHAASTALAIARPTNSVRDVFAPTAVIGPELR